MRRKGALLALAAALGGCAEYVPPAPAPPSSPPPARPSPRRSPVDSCGAAGLQYLVGRPVAEIPQTAGRHEQRVIAQGAQVRERFEPERLTLLYDEQTGRIADVHCG